MENFDFAHRLKDSYPWVILASVALFMDYVCFKGVNWVVRWIVNLF